MVKLTTEHKSILLRFLQFSVLFIIVTGISGSWVVSTRLLDKFYFFIYGNLGKMVLISVIGFCLLIRNRIGELEKLPYIRASFAEASKVEQGFDRLVKAKTNIPCIILAFLLIPVFFILGNNLLQYKSPISNIPLFLLTHGILIFIPALLLPGIFGFRYLISFVKLFWKELSVCLGVSIVIDLAIFQVWKLWPIFSDGVLGSVRFLLSLTTQNIKFIEPRILVVNNFAISIEQACSGLDSLFLFSSLYLFIVILDFKEFNKIKLAAMLAPAAIGLYLVNIFRVYILIIIGAYVSADLATKLFHTYLGMVLFIIFFFVFWKLFYSWMKR